MEGGALRRRIGWIYIYIYIPLCSPICLSVSHCLRWLCLSIPVSRNLFVIFFPGAAPSRIFIERWTFCRYLAAVREAEEDKRRIDAFEKMSMFLAAAAAAAAAEEGRR